MYAFVCIRFGIGIPCPIHALTGLYCPGCGISRMMLALIRGDFGDMFRYNLVLPFILPVLAVLIVYDEVKYIRYGSIVAGKIHNSICIIIIAVLLVYGVIRNIPGVII